jgi:uncharacterized protein (TIGR03382 family)
MAIFTRTCAVVVAVAAAGVLVSVPAEAHFVLQAPASWMPEDSTGSPQKLGPCGDESDDAGLAPTGTVTAVQAGQKITVTIDEVVFHPGHYRIALAVNNRSELPAEPAVTAGSTPCGSAAIENPAVFPVLADDVFDHTAQFTSPQSIEVTIPANVTCTKCTLQVIEFMADHGLNVPGGCFYHHCADLSVTGAGASSSSSGATSSESTATSGVVSTTTGGTVTVSHAGTSSTSTGRGGSAGSTATAEQSGGQGTAGASEAGSSSGQGSSGCSTGADGGSTLLAMGSLAGLSAIRMRRRRR